MKRTILATAVLAALVGTAVAADLPSERVVRAPAAVEPSAMSWTGCYLGAGGGYGLLSQDTFNQTDPAHVATTATSSSSGRGWFGTAQGGCDVQWGSFVIGAFGDYDFSGITGNYNPPGTLLFGEEKLKSQWAAGARAGLLVLPQLLAYLSGGYTQAHFDQIDLNFVLLPSGAAGLSYPAHTYSGWFLGSGYEYAITWLPGLFWKTEYRYSTFTADNLSLRVTGTNVLTGTAINSKKDIQSIRSELVWRFNWH